MAHIVNPNLVGDRSPTPPIVYEPRIWKARIWVENGPFEGISLIFKAPYGQGMNAATVLARAIARYQILRLAFGPARARDFAKLNRKNLLRFDEAFEAVARAWAIDWAA